MEIVQGKHTDKKIVVAQEIAFAKVLSGNNKTLRDRAIKKLRKWLTVRGNGKWTFTEDEFIRIWTGLFYCMWMSDKFLVQEELAENISKLIHCFKKNSDTALLFIKCFNKRILMDWEGLDQYRIDKFNMLVRRFLRQSFVYCKEKDWDIEILKKLTGIFYSEVLHKDCALGFVLHFISIYLEELAKVCEGKLTDEVVQVLVEPFVKLLVKTPETRIQKAIQEFLNYLMQQTDTGIEFEEQFRAWKEHGFPGEGPHCMKPVKSNGTDDFLENGNEFSDEEEESDDENPKSRPLDPRAGSVHVYLPQIPVNPDKFIELFKKHIKAKHSTPTGRRLLKNYVQKYTTLKKGKFPITIKKDPFIVETKKTKRTVKKARELLNFTEEIKDGPIRTKEFLKMSEELEESDNESDESKELEESENESEETQSDVEWDNQEEENEELVSDKKNDLKNKIVNNKKAKKKGKKESHLKENMGEVETPKKKKPKQMQNDVEWDNTEDEDEEQVSDKKNGLKNKIVNNKKEKKSEKKVKKESPLKENMEEEETPKKKKPKVKKKKNEVQVEDEDTKQKGSKKQEEQTTPVNGKVGTKRKILSNWQVQELDANSPEYYEIKTPKIIRIERKIEEENDWEDEEECPQLVPIDTLEEVHESEEKEVTPVFWEKAKAKAAKGKKGAIFKNPFAEMNGESKSPGMRRISFALEKNMAQENEEYLEEVKNSPRVPFDGSKKPVQSALKSGLAPSPVNPFYKFKKIKF